MVVNVEGALRVDRLHRQHGNRHLLTISSALGSSCEARIVDAGIYDELPRHRRAGFDIIFRDVECGGGIRAWDDRGEERGECEEHHLRRHRGAARRREGGRTAERNRSRDFALPHSAHTDRYAVVVLQANYWSIPSF